MKKKLIIALCIAILISIALHFIKWNEVPPCVNADEASFAYNAYSILKTGRDEYGTSLPLRLKSFSDQKMPLYAYLAIPSIAMFGLNDFSVRLPNAIFGILMVPLMFFLANELFKNKKIALLAAYSTALSPAMYILSRHAHETVSSTFFILLAFLLLLRWMRTNSWKSFLLSDLLLLLASFSYHSARIYIVFFAAVQLIFILKNHFKKSLFLLTIAVILIPFAVDAMSGADRVNNLLYINNPGFHLQLKEYLVESSNRLLHNELTQSITEVTQRYLLQVSPDFLVVTGDKDQRFGFSKLGLITPFEYIFIFIGIAYLFIKKHRHRYLLTALFAITPLVNALTWRDPSINRTYMLFFIIFLTVPYGIMSLIESTYKYKYSKVILLLSFLLFYGFFLVTNWDLYLNHYPKRTFTRNSWQCGYRELTAYVKEQYDNYDHFYITDTLGQPYIFFLFYGTYDPSKYQRQASISSPDKYGFGQVFGFDKYTFGLSKLPENKNSIAIGMKIDFQSVDISSYEQSPLPGDDRFVILKKK